MRLQSLLLSRLSSLWAGRPWIGLWAAVVLLTPQPLTVFQVPTATIVDSDIITDTVWTLAGSPYEVAFVASGILVAEGATLTVEPGVEVRFDDYASLIVEGTLKAIGTTAQPILFTGVTKEPGSWLFLVIQGNGAVRNQGSVLRHVTIEYAEQNLMLYAATAHVSDCVLRYAGDAGLWGGWAEGTVVERCRIVDNGISGIENSIGGVILAANNWWGSAGGPSHAGCNATGTGDVIEDAYSQGVAFRPFLTAPDQEVAPVTAGEALRLSLSPQRWFAPADGVTLIPVEMTLRDGAGRPLSGRTVCLSSDLGNAGGCSLTGVDGKALTYVSSDTPGDAALWARVQDAGTCEIVGSTEAAVTFVEAAADALLPGAEAPYMNGQIEVEPLPIVQGVPSTVRVTLTNPNDYPILVDAAFGYAHFSIGVSFAPLGGVEDVRIEANSDKEISVSWTPPESGHVCLRVTYTYMPAGISALDAQAVGGSGQTNFDIEPGSLGSPGPEDDGDPDEEEPDEGDTESEKDMTERAKKAIERISDGQTALDAVSAPENLPGMAIPNLMFSYIMDFNLETWSQATAALGNDPPRQDYDTYAMLEEYTFTPLVAGGDLSVARAKAGNLLMEAMLDLTAELRAAAVSLDRYAGAADAGDPYWASEQAAMLIAYKETSGATMLDVADRIDGLLAVMEAEGYKDLTVTVATVEAYQDRLENIGFNRTEINAAATIGLSGAELEAVRQARIAADPKEVAGSVMTRLADVAARLRLLGAVMMDPPNFDEMGTCMMGASSAAESNLARIFAGRTFFEIGNPLPDAATVELRVRRLDLPSDWMVSVSPASVDLAPGEVVTGAVTIRPGLPAVQGTRSRVAVEGTIDGELIGGVVVEVMVPRHVLPGPKMRVFLPVVMRQ